MTISFRKHFFARDIRYYYLTVSPFGNISQKKRAHTWRHSQNFSLFVVALEATDTNGVREVQQLLFCFAFNEDENNVRREQFNVISRHAFVHSKPLY